MEMDKLGQIHYESHEVPWANDIPGERAEETTFGKTIQNVPVNRHQHH